LLEGKKVNLQQALKGVSVPNGREVPAK